MVNKIDLELRAWPRARAGFEADPLFHRDLSAQKSIDMSNALHAVANRIQQEYSYALRMYCAGQSDYAKGYLVRAEYVYQVYGTEENYNRVPAHSPEAAIYNRGTAKTYYAAVQLALYGHWDLHILKDGLQDLHEYLLGQTYDSTSAYLHEDEDRLLTVLCQMAIGEFDTAIAWFDAYIKYRKIKKFKENFPELLAGIQAQLKRGKNEVAAPLKAYFDQNRLGNYQFRKPQSFWLCVPIAIIAERIASDWRGTPVWDQVLEQLLY